MALHVEPESGLFQKPPKSSLRSRPSKLPAEAILSLRPDRDVGRGTVVLAAGLHVLSAAEAGRLVPVLNTAPAERLRVRTWARCSSCGLLLSFELRSLGSASASFTARTLGAV